MKHAICILSFQRAEVLYKKTYKLMKNMGYSDDEIFVFISDDDTMKEVYKKMFKNVIIFKRTHFAADERINRKGNAAAHARNFIYKYCRDNNIEEFIMFDDDNVNFYYTGCKNKVKSLKKINEKIFNAFKLMPERVKLIAFAQSGDFIGSQFFFVVNQNPLRRKAMNYFYCLSGRPVEWIGLTNEDVCLFTRLANVGELCFTIWAIYVQSTPTQKKMGGLTEVYKSDGGTYLKSFLPVLACPTAVRIAVMGTNDFRLHHRITWKKLAPAILKNNC